MGKALHRSSARALLRAAGFSIISALIAGGCGGRAHMPPVAWSTRPGDAEVFQVLLSTLRSRGYVPESSDPGAGTVSVAAQHHVRGEAIRFTFQCYADGEVELIPSGPRVEREDDTYRMPSAVGVEYRELAFAVTEALGGGAR